METAPLKSFATWARRELITQVSAPEFVKVDEATGSQAAGW